MFVTFEGIEGSGKTTAQCSILVDLIGEGHQALNTSEPGAGDLGKRIRQLLLHGGDVSPEAELMLFLADRANHVSTIIRPELVSGSIVLCDRYADSTVVYQGMTRGLDLDFIKRANEFATGGLAPDLTLLFDLPVEVGLARVRNPDRLDAEPLEFHQKVRDSYLVLASADPSRWKVLDATLKPDLLARQALDRIIEWLERSAGNAR
jgi:dTMP kinase